MCFPENTASEAESKLHAERLLGREDSLRKGRGLPSIIRRSVECVMSTPDTPKPSTGMSGRTACRILPQQTDDPAPRRYGMKRHHRNDGLRKICACPRRKWTHCPHSWYFSFQWRKVHHRFSLDRHLGRHVVGKTAASTAADKIRAAIRNGDFAPLASDPTPARPDPITFDTFADLYLERALHGRRDDAYRLKALKAFVLPPPSGQRLGAKVLTQVTEDDLETVLDHVRALGRAASTCNK